MKLQYHPLAELFPMMNESEFASLRADMRDHGYDADSPVMLLDGQILDGRNRHEAALAEGLAPIYRDYTGDQPLEYVIRHNLKRRHLSESQRAIVAGRIANMGEGGDHSANLQSGKVSQSAAAEMMGVSTRTVASVKAVEKAAPELLEKIASGEMTAHEAEKEVKTKRRTEARAVVAAAGAAVAKSDKWHVYRGDIATWKAPRQYDYIITDPPYKKEFVPLYSILGQRAAEWLKPGGLLVAMSAHYYLNELYRRLDEHLTYFWTAAYLVPGETGAVFQKHINPQWKPILIYQNPGERSARAFADVFRSNANDKSMHKWGQSESGMFDIISKLCLSGEYILDPFCGAGTTGVAALAHGCLFDGLELEVENANLSRGRLAEAAQ